MQRRRFKGGRAVGDIAISRQPLLIDRGLVGESDLENAVRAIKVGRRRYDGSRRGTRADLIGRIAALRVCAAPKYDDQTQEKE